jgi:hypothetical protein
MIFILFLYHLQDLIFFLYAFRERFGTYIFAFLLMFLKAFFPITGTLVDWKVMRFRFLHPEKAFAPIFRTDFPNVTFFIFLLFLYAFF